MKVLHVVPSVAPRYGGPSEAALRSVVALREAGIGAIIATTDADGPDCLPVPKYEETDYEGARCIFFPRLPGESLKPSPALGRWLRQNVGSFDVTHIHSVFTYSSLAAGRAARRSHVPYIVRPLGQLDFWSLSQHRLRKQMFLVAGGKTLLVRAEALHWTDESERARAPDYAAERPSFVVPLGVDESLFSGTDSPEARDRSLLFLSRLHPKKNLETLLEAFSRLGDVAVGWKLVVAGDGDAAYVASLKCLAASAGVGASVEFAGWLSGVQKRDVLGRAALLVLPSLQENFGIAVAEAMAAGTPVVVSDAVGLSEDVRRVRAGWVAPAGAAGLAAVLAEAMGSSEERLRRGQEARRHARQRYRWAAVAGQLAAEYERLLSGGEGRQ